MNSLINLIGRAGLSAIPVLSGLAKLSSGYEGAQGCMEALGVPGALLPVVILVEIVGGFALAAGIHTRWAAIGLAVFAAASAFLLPVDFGEQGQVIKFVKNIVIAGGFLMVAAYGAGRWSLDHWLANRRVALRASRPLPGSTRRPCGDTGTLTEANVPQPARF